MEDKCSMEHCIAFDKTSKMVRCRAFCNRRLHGHCIGASRDWYHPSLDSNFICDDCQNTESLLRTLYDNIANKITNLNLDKECLIKKQQSILNTNADNFNVMAKTFDNLASTVSDISDAHQAKDQKQDKYLCETITTTITNLFEGQVFKNLLQLVTGLDNKCDSLAASNDELHSRINALHVCSSKNFEQQRVDSELSTLKDMIQEIQQFNVNQAKQQSPLPHNPPSQLAETTMDLVTLPSSLQIPTQHIADLPPVPVHNHPPSQSVATNTDRISFTLAPPQTPIQHHTDLPPPIVDDQLSHGQLNRYVSFDDLLSTSKKSKSKKTNQGEKAPLDVNQRLPTNGSRILKGAPRHADADWLTNHFRQKYSIEVCDCEIIIPRRLKEVRYRCFKLSMPQKYGWLFLSPNKGGLVCGKMEIAEWNKKSKNKYKKSISNWSFSRYIPDTLPTNFLPKPHNNTNASNHPNFTRATKFPSFTKASNIFLTPPANKYPNFIQGQTLNPSHSKISNPPPANNSPNYKINSAPNVKGLNPASTSFIDPLTPPVVKLTIQSAAEEEGRYLLSRLRDYRISENIRLYLAYLHDQPDSVCINGKTKTSVKISIQQEGFPTEYKALRDIFDRYHASYGESSTQVSKDLAAYSSYLRSQRRSHLQKTREDHNKFFRG